MPEGWGGGVSYAQIWLKYLQYNTILLWSQIRTRPWEDVKVQEVGVRKQEGGGIQ